MLLTLKQASQWASKHLNKNVTTANISYLIQYGHLETSPEKGTTLIPLQSLENYYGQSRREKQWKDELGDDLNWTLSFEKIKEAETTKHVHRLHPYKGKFIPQLVEYFLDARTDDFNMYPTIADMAGMHIVNQHKRPVLNRTEKNRETAYPETIFRLKEKRA